MQRVQVECDGTSFFPFVTAGPSWCRGPRLHQSGRCNKEGHNPHGPYSVPIRYGMAAAGFDIQ